MTIATRPVSDIAHCRGRAAGVWDHLQFDAGAFLQEFYGQMRDAAAPCRRIAQLAGLVLCKCDQLGQRLHAYLWRHRNEHRLVGNEADRREIAW